MQENQVKKRRGLSSNFRFPHSYVIIFCIIVLMAIMSYIIPAGQFDRAVDPTSGREVVVPGTFHYVDQKPVSPFQLFVDIQEGFISAAYIIFFIVFAYGFVYILIKNGTFDALIGGLLRIFGKRVSILIPVCMTLFIFLGSTVGILEETYGMVPIFIGLAIAMGYDAIVGSAMVYVGAAHRLCRRHPQPLHHRRRPADCRGRVCQWYFLPHLLRRRLRGNCHRLHDVVCAPGQERPHQEHPLR